MKRAIITATMLATLTACGGGGGPGMAQPLASTQVTMSDYTMAAAARVNLKDASRYTGTDVMFMNVLTKGDINNDGYDDFVVGLFRHTNIPSYSGRDWDPSGEVKPVVLFYDPNADTYVVNEQLQDVMPLAQHPRQAAIVDLDGDGRKDIFIGDHGYDDAPYGNQNILILNTASGFSNGSHLLPQYSDFSHGLVVADFDGNGKDDLLVINNTVENNTKCTKYSAFTECSYNPPKYSLSYVLFNNGNAQLTQGKLDLPDDVFNFNIANQTKSHRLYVGHSNDFNGDGKPDLVFSNHANVYIFESKDTYTKFDKVATIMPPASLSSCKETPSSAITSKDMDGDGVNEVIISTTCELNTAYFRVFKRDAEGNWQDKSDIFLGDQSANTSLVRDGWCYKFELSDVNGDATPDLICQSVRGQGDGNNNVFWYDTNGRLEYSGASLQNGNWAAFHSVVKDVSGTSIVGFSWDQEGSYLEVRRWKK